MTAEPYRVAVMPPLLHEVFSRRVEVQLPVGFAEARKAKALERAVRRRMGCMAVVFG